MVASSSINHRQNKPFQSRGGGTKGAISAIVAAGSPTGQFYRDGEFRPTLAEMQGISGFDMAGHIAVVVSEKADPLSKAASIATEFVEQYPNSKKLYAGALVDQPQL